MLYIFQAQTGAPCLSFDILHDSLGESRTEYPMTAYLVAGTQAEQGKQNFVILMKMSELHSTYQGNDEDSELTGLYLHICNFRKYLLT